MMSKELLIMRHAKSSWDDESLTDHQRPLNKRGLRDAPRMAQFLVGQQIVPDLIISSDANRARTTAELVAENLNVSEVIVEFIEDFYLAPPDVYIEYALRLADQFERPMFVGHNPGMEHLVNGLSNGDWESMPTGAIAHVVFDFEKWADFDNTSLVRSVSVFRPKQINDYDG